MKTDIAIRPAALSDAPACAAILNAWIDETHWMPRVHSHEDVERHYRDFVFSKRTVLVAADTSVAGYAALDRDECFVTSFYVYPQSRSMGLGKRLMDEAKALSPDGLKLWTFVANTDGRRFYEREGFAELERSDGDNEENLPDILFGWPTS